MHKLYMILIVSSKKSRCEVYKAKVILHGKDFNEAEKKAKELAEKRGLIYISS